MVEIKSFHLHDEESSIAEVTFGEDKVEVRFWGSYTVQLNSDEELEAYIIAEANKKLGNIPQAKATLVPYAQGENAEHPEVIEVDGRQVTHTVGLDSRNWAQIWIDKN